MTGHILILNANDASQRIMLDLEVEPSLKVEGAPPYRLAVRSRSPGLLNGNGEALEVWVRFTRIQAATLHDQIEAALEDVSTTSGSKLIKRTRITSVLNGGVNNDTGDMVIALAGKGGVEHHLDIPCDQSGMMEATLQTAAEAAAKWQDGKLDAEKGKLKPLNIQPREAEMVLLGDDPASGRPILVVRLEGGHQFSFMLDRQLFEGLRYGTDTNRKRSVATADRLGTIAEDIDWFANHWGRLYQPPIDVEIRQGAAALRRLLHEDALGWAWRACGFEKEPQVKGPDLFALIEQQGLIMDHIEALIVGGATVNGLQHSLIGFGRCDNATTGVKADAGEGFAIQTFNVSRDARNGDSVGGLSDFCETEMFLSAYLDAPGAVKSGTAISRRQIILYFANSFGGVHLDGIGPPSKRRGKTASDSDLLLDALQNKIRADIMDGLYFVVLSIGQAIGRSEDLKRLAEVIRTRPVRGDG